MVLRKIRVLSCAAVTLALAGLGQGAPVPRLAPTRWELDFAFRDPLRITVTLPGDQHPTTFWYLLFTVTNNSGQDVEFYPTFDIVTDTLQTVEGGADISPRVQDAIRERHKSEYPFFVDPTKLSGKLMQGEDNARTSCAIFRTFDPQASRFTIYIAGLSGEIQRQRNVGFDPKQPESEKNPKFFTLRKTLAMTYELPGDPQTRKDATPARVNREWVMR
ncbi:MAG TPA: hypothetical protein VGM03_23445 [Phycisphaerae bacterium]|jgi:hypothetical protein